MVDESVQRGLAAILAADVVGYSRLMGGGRAGDPWLENHPHGVGLSEGNAQSI